MPQVLEAPPHFLPCYQNAVSELHSMFLECLVDCSMGVDSGETMDFDGSWAKIAIIKIKNFELR